MANENETPTNTDPPAGGGVPGGTPPAGTVPPNGQGGAGGGGQPGKNNGKPKFPKAPPVFQLVPERAFSERVKLEAARILKKSLGIELDEAKEIVANGGSVLKKGSESEVVQAAVATATKKVQDELAEARAELDKTKKGQSAWENKYKKDTQKLRDRATEVELRYKANAAGLIDADYAVTLFARAVTAGKATDPDEFFKGLKTTHTYLFKPAEGGNSQAAAPPVVVPPSTAPPESLQPGEKKPEPSPTGPNQQKTVDDLAPHEFAARTRQMYGFTPGA